MAKGSKSNKKKTLPVLSDSDMDDDIDVFHKQRDVVPLDLDNDAADSDEDNDQHVFDIQDVSEDDEDEDEDDSEEDTGLAAKIARQQKSLRAKHGGAEDETLEDVEDEEKGRVGWGKGKNIYYDQGKGESDEDEEEEKEVLRLLNEKTKQVSNADYGVEDDSEEEPTFENLSKGKGRSKAKLDHDAPEDEMETEVVVKDPNSLSKEEQMDIVYNSAPELVGLLSELNEAVDQLETKVDPILSKLKEEKNINKNGVQYMEVKKQLLLSYCQAISFHLLLKSEGHSVLDHPVLARIVEIKNLLDKMKSLDESISFDIEDFLKNHVTANIEDSPMEITAVDSAPLINNAIIPETQKEPLVGPKKNSTVPLENGGKRKRDDEKVGLQSAEMLKVRAELVEKLKQKGLFNLKATKTDGVKKSSRLLNGKLEGRDDFDDDAFNIDGKESKSSSKLSQLITQRKKPKVISGDDDLPKRDDIGERRRKHEMRVLSNAGVQSDDDLQENELEPVEGDDEDGETEDGDTDSESDLYEQAKLKRDAKLAAKSQKYSRTAPSVPAAPEMETDGKRHINRDMEKNRGLTRKRNKENKNPRKNYKRKHKKKETARKGQVRDIRKSTGPYGGEGTGINNAISRSIRFKS